MEKQFAYNRGASVISKGAARLSKFNHRIHPLGISVKANCCVLSSTSSTHSQMAAASCQTFGAVIGVSNCYVFKSRLQEYAQKKGFLTPVYDTVKEGPSHEPCFRSAVIVNNVRYNSLPGFFNRKAAEQSAAEVALLELAKAEGVKESICYPVHETGLCKNLLQEYAQKMNYAIPCYVCLKGETPERKPLFTCTVDIGGIQYVGAAARTKKEAEIKAARTALLAIQSHTSGTEGKSNGGFQLTVVPGKKKVMESETKKEETKKALKPKKPRLKRKWSRGKGLRNHIDQVARNVESSLASEVPNAGTQEANKVDHGDENIASELNQNQPESVTEMNNSSQNGQITALDVNPIDQGYSSKEIVSEIQINNLVNKAAAGDAQVAPIVAADVPVVMSENFGSENSSVHLNQNEDGRRAVEGEIAERIGDQVQASYELHQSGDVAS